MFCEVRVKKTKLKWRESGKVLPVSNTHEDTGHIHRSRPSSSNGVLQLSEDRVLDSTATSYTSGEVFASSGSPTCNGFVHPTRVAQSSVELILVMVVQMLQQARRG